MHRYKFLGTAGGRKQKVTSKIPDAEDADDGDGATTSQAQAQQPDTVDDNGDDPMSNAYLDFDDYPKEPYSPRYIPDVAITIKGINYPPEMDNNNETEDEDS